MNQLRVIVKGQEYSLVVTELQNRFFIHNSINVDEINSFQRLKPYRTYGTGSYAPVSLNGEIHHLNYAYEWMAVFSFTGEKKEYRDEKYPVAATFKYVEATPVKPLKSFVVNGLIAKKEGSDWTYPHLSDPDLMRICSENKQGIYSLLDRYYTFSEEATDLFEKVYNEKREALIRDYENWKKRQLIEFSEVKGLKIVDVVKNPNETATYTIENPDGTKGYIHEYTIYDRVHKDIPEYIEEVRVSTWGDLEYKYEGKWHQSLNDIHLDQDINF